MTPTPEVKGTWFVTLRAFAQRELPGVLPELAAHMPRWHQVIEAPEQGEWYPEDALHEVFEALWEHVGRDEARFIELSRGVSHEGVGRFFRALLGLSSAKFLLRQVPTMWRRLRRGDAALVEVESRENGSLVRYSKFPWFDHRVYTLFTIGSLTALAELAEPGRHRVEVVEAGPGLAGFLVEHR